ncbi:hypothetical protein H4R34_004363 [Dimargaris verticillata]|uniref:CID domain-containing protein n=1 Tax=Dimargaris verticillata TaxID=2761393 RepID=A0A9W8E7B6_9FUNG|nr:hypothetical protein H4R34_004363 [Dimargaris verticillata]
MSKFSTQAFQEKLHKLTDTQDSISLLSQWMIYHRRHIKEIVETWYEVLKTASVRQQLTLFHLCNDVLQARRKKGQEYRDAFRVRLPEAVEEFKQHAPNPLLGRLVHVLDVWQERSVYDKAFVAKLHELLAVDGTPSPKPDGQLSRLTRLDRQLSAAEALDRQSDQQCMGLLAQLNARLNQGDGQPVDQLLPQVMHGWNQRQHELQKHVALRRDLIDALTALLVQQQEKLTGVTKQLKDCELTLERLAPLAPNPPSHSRFSGGKSASAVHRSPSPATPLGSPPS